MANKRRKTAPDIRITVGVSPELHARFVRVCELTGVTYSQVLRNAITLFANAPVKQLISIRESVGDINDEAGTLDDPDDGRGIGAEPLSVPTVAKLTGDGRTKVRPWVARRRWRP